MPDKLKYKIGEDEGIVFSAFCCFGYENYTVSTKKRAFSSRVDNNCYLIQNRFKLLVYLMNKKKNLKSCPFELSTNEDESIPPSYDG